MADEAEAERVAANLEKEAAKLIAEEQQRLSEQERLEKVQKMLAESEAKEELVRIEKEH